MERIKAAANSRLMRLAQKMIVGGALLLDRVANSRLHRLAALPVEHLFPAFVNEICRFSSRQDSRTTFAWSPSNGQAAERGHPFPPHQSGFPLTLIGAKSCSGKCFALKRSTTVSVKTGAES
jgi:hypothetical protein